MIIGYLGPWGLGLESWAQGLGLQVQGLSFRA